MEKQAKQTKTSGSFKVSDEVIVRITEVAATEISGVAANGQRLVLAEKPIPIPNQIKNLTSPVRVNLTAESAEIDVSIVIESGYNTTTVASAVQKSVKSAVQSMTGITVSKVNVIIAGIKFNKE